MFPTKVFMKGNPKITKNKIKKQTNKNKTRAVTGDRISFF